MIILVLGQAIYLAGLGNAIAQEGGLQNHCDGLVPNVRAPGETQPLVEHPLNEKGKDVLQTKQHNGKKHSAAHPQGRGKVKEVLGPALIDKQEKNQGHRQSHQPCGRPDQHQALPGDENHGVGKPV